MALVGGSLPDDEAARLKAHVEQCVDCRWRVSAVAGQRRSSSTIEAAPPALDSNTIAEVPKPRESAPARPLYGGRFELGRFVRSGGMGDVYQAKDRQTGETVALKIMKKLEEEDEDRFE